jgi:hypothetical protein
MIYNPAQPIHKSQLCLSREVEAMSFRRAFVLLVVVLLALSNRFATLAIAELQGEERPIPVRLLAPSLLIDAPVEPIKVTEGTVQGPTGLWTAGLIGSPARLDGTGINAFFGYTEFSAAGPGAFQYLDQAAPGQEIAVIGSDGLHYRYEIVSNEFLPAVEALGQMYSSPPGASTWIVLVAWARYDPTIGGSPGVIAVKAVRSGSLEPSEPISSPFPATEIVGCPLIQYLPPQFAYSAVAELHISEAVPSTPRLTRELDEVAKIAFPNCGVDVKVSVTLSDGNSLALLGPIGQVELSSLAGAVDEATVTVVDPQRATMFTFVLFINDGAAWGAYLPPLV